MAVEMATTSGQLSAGAIAQILNLQDVDKPVLQVISVWPMSSDSYRIRLWDGLRQYDNFIVHSPDLSPRIKDKEFDEFAVIVLNEYNARSFGPVIDINNMSVQTPGHRIGHKLVDNERRDGVRHQIEKRVSPRVEPKTDINANIEPPSVATKTTTITLAVDTTEYCAIKSLTTATKSWTVRGRVTAKAPKRQWSNMSCNGGSVFSFEMSDQSGDIRVNAFNEECEKYYPLIKVNKVIVVSQGNIRVADKRYSTVDNDHEILLNKFSSIKEYPSDDLSDIPKIKHKFTKIKDIISAQIGAVVEVIAIVKHLSPKDEFVNKNGRNTTKLDLILVDDSWNEIGLTLWNETANQLICDKNAIIAAKNVVVKDYEGRSLSSMPNTSLVVEPFLPESESLRKWRSSDYNQYLKVHPSHHNLFRCRRPSNRKLLCQINEADGQNKNVFYVRAKVAHIRRKLLYKGCYRKHCLREVLAMSDGLYRCDKCKIDSEEFEWRITMEALIVDSTADRWVTVFHNEAQRLIQISAENLNHLEENNPAEFEKVLSSPEFRPFVFKIGAKTDNIDAEDKLKLVVHEFKPLDPIKYAKRLLPDIDKLNDSESDEPLILI